MNVVESLREPSMILCDQNSDDRMRLHKEIIDRKFMIRDVFVEMHHIFRAYESRYALAEGMQIELGAGVFPVSKTYPEVISSDIVVSEGVDMLLDAHDMNLPNNSVRCFYGQNCFHHFHDPDKFFKELDRTLKVGGCAIMMDPYYGALASIIYPRLFKNEGFEKGAHSWKNDATGPMNDANQALSYVVFKRDRALFNKKHPNLEICAMEPLGNYIRYLMSGGLNFRQLLPDRAIPALRVIEKVLLPIRKYMALHHVIVIRKK